MDQGMDSMDIHEETQENKISEPDSWEIIKMEAREFRENMGRPSVLDFHRIEARQGWRSVQRE